MKASTYIFFVGLLTACGSSQEKFLKPPFEEKTISSGPEEGYDYLTIRDTMLEGYRFKFGYYKYNQDSFGYQNPGYFEVYNGSKKIFYDSLKAYEILNFNSMGFHNLNPKMLVVNLFYGLAACDYPNCTRLYGITNDKVYFIDELTDIGNEHAGISTGVIFPEDSIGIKGYLMITEALQFNRTGNPEDTIEFDKADTDRFDTTIWQFKAAGFRKIRQTRNISPEN